ncbi:hypothetical protein PENTCL1PPCAC_4604, partial [Pristionchus entomophagus]
RNMVAGDQLVAKEFVKKEGIKNVKFLKSVVISKADQLAVLDAINEKEHRKKFAKELRGTNRLIRVNIEKCDPPTKKKRN